MTKLKYIFFLLFTLQVFSQQSIDFQDKPFSELMAQAKAENKLIFLDAYAAWCGPCKLLEKNIFPLQSVREYYNKTFINTHIDMEKGEGIELAKKYQIYSYPSLLFINGDGDIVQKALGYMGEGQFLELGKSVANSSNPTESPRARFARGEKDPAFLESVIQNNANSDYEFAKLASERYLLGKKGQPITKEDVSYILFFLKSVKDPNYKTFVERKSEIIAFIPPETYNQFDQQIKLSEILQASVNADDGTINDAYFFKNATPLVGQEEATNALNKVKVTIYPQMGNFEAYEKAALEYYKNPDNFEVSELDRASWLFSQNITNVKSLNQAKVWAEKSVMKSESPENTYILAKLYQKTGDATKAKSFAEMSKNLAIKTGQDSSLAELLLKELSK